MSLLYCSLQFDSSYSEHQQKWLSLLVDDNLLFHIIFYHYTYVARAHQCYSMVEFDHQVDMTITKYTLFIVFISLLPMAYKIRYIPFLVQVSSFELFHIHANVTSNIIQYRLNDEYSREITCGQMITELYYSLKNLVPS